MTSSSVLLGLPGFMETPVRFGGGGGGFLNKFITGSSSVDVSVEKLLHWLTRLHKVLAAHFVLESIR